MELKIILYCDENIYEDIYRLFLFFDEEKQIEYAYFNRDNYDIKHISTNRFINYSINNVSGYTKVTHVLIQKSFYRNRDLIKILKRFRYFNPGVKLLLIFDDDKDYYVYLLHLIAKDKLCSVAFSNNDILKWFDSDCKMFDHSNLVKKKIRNRDLKEFQKY